MGDGWTARPRSTISTSLAVAIINFLFGSLLGGAVGAWLADIRSDRDLQRTWLQERSKHQMSVRKLFLDEQRATVDALYPLISRLRTASADLIDITSPDYEERNYDPGEARQGMKKLKIVRRIAYNDALDAWDQARYVYDFSLTSYHGDGREIQRAWGAVRDAANEYAECASDWYLKVFRGEAQYTEDMDEPCVEKLDHLDERWRARSAALRDGRRAAWSDWESPPQRLK